jgi:putative membrane protein
MRTSSREPAILLAVGIVLLVVSGIGPYDRTTWVLEIFPIVLAIPALILTRARFPLTPLVYRLIFIHALILMLGGHYTYARVPLGFWVQDLLGLARNHYDRLGHFAQGFVPALVAREILLRTSPLHRGKWLFVLVTSVCLAISACYEFIEWWSAVIGGSAATDFLGTQGDVWDTQWDMFLAFVGAMTAQLTLARVHDRQLVRLVR